MKPLQLHLLPDPMNKANDRQKFDANGRQFSLSRRYAVASLPVILALMLFIGWWVNRVIEKQVIVNSAANVALYVQGFLAQELQVLAYSDFLKEEEMQTIERLINKTPLGKKIRSVKVWKRQGLVSYYSRRALIGQRFEPTENLKGAWDGRVTAEFDDLDDAEDSPEAAMKVPLLEVYSPVRRRGSDEIIAVVEFYQDAQVLATHLSETRLRTWLVVISSTLIAYGLLFIIVFHGSQIIRKQRQYLKHQVDELSRLLGENRELEARLKRAAQRTAEVNEKLLRRVSAELHDGPAQSMSLALLRLDALSNSNCPDTSAIEVIDELRRSLQESMTELRYISRGLALPDLKDLTLLDIIERVISEHQRRTSTSVDLAIDRETLAITATMPVKLTLYRAIQESLMNAYRHAGGVGQRISVTIGQNMLHVETGDSGPGFSPESLRRSDRLGLHGLRERIESLGGMFELFSRPGEGTRISCSIPLTSQT